MGVDIGRVCSLFGLEESFVASLLSKIFSAKQASAFFSNSSHDPINKHPRLKPPLHTSMVSEENT